MNVLALSLPFPCAFPPSLPAKCVLMFPKETQNFASGNAAQHLKYLSILLGSCSLFSFRLCACLCFSSFLCLSSFLCVPFLPTPLLCVVCLRIIFLTLLLDFFTSEWSLSIGWMPRKNARGLDGGPGSQSQSQSQSHSQSQGRWRAQAMASGSQKRFVMFSWPRRKRKSTQILPHTHTHTESQCIFVCVQLLVCYCFLFVADALPRPTPPCHACCLGLPNVIISVSIAILVRDTWSICIKFKSSCWHWWLTLSFCFDVYQRSWNTLQQLLSRGLATMKAKESFYCVQKSDLNET